MKTLILLVILPFCFTHAFSQLELDSISRNQIDQAIRKYPELTNSTKYFDKYISIFNKKFKDKKGVMHISTPDLEADVSWDSDKILTYAIKKGTNEWMFRHLDKKHFYAANIKIWYGGRADISILPNQKDRVLRALDTAVESFTGLPIVELD